MLEKAIKWIKNNTLQGEGIVVSSKKRYSYPEVTGYLIPTLLSIGERKLACEYAKWLVDLQKPDGSFSAPGSSLSYIFDTGQVLRGWINIVHYLPELENSINKACNWIVANSNSEGRLFLLDPPGAWSLGERGFINEGVHLYVLHPLLKAGEILNKPNYIKFARKSLSYYKKNINLTDFNKPNALTHFFCYIQDALVELGEIELAHNGMNSLAAFQQENGALPAFSDVKWVCTPGQIQAAIVWYKLGEYERADRALTFIEQFMNPSGGFFGSYGVGANYFPSEEISWATKFYIDAYLLRIERFFDKEHSIFSETIEPNDGRLNTILNYVGNLKGCNVLDVGCGKGRFANAIKRVYPKVNLYGLDISEELLKSVPPNIKTFKGSMLNIPFKDNFFDVVYCVEALEHAVRVEQAIREMCRVLKPGGKLIIIDKNAEKWGSMKTTQWEQWFSPEGLTDLIKKYCNEVKWEFIGYDQQKIPDGIFVAWVGRKIESGMVYCSADFVEHSTSMLPENKKYRPLVKEEWHKAIIGGASPSEVAERISKRQVPEWVKPLIDNTKEGDLVIELGSGTGELSAYLSYKGRKVILVDYSQDNLNFSREVFKHLGLSGEFVLADVTKKLPFPDNYADLVWSSGLLEHFSDDEIVRILKESKRISRRAVLSFVPNANSIPYRLGKWLQEQTGEWKWGYEDPKFSMVNFYKEAGLYDINEYSIAVMHSLNFLTLAEFNPFKNKLQAFFESLSPRELQQLNQGYLLVTKGYIKPLIGTDLSSTNCSTLSKVETPKICLHINNNSLLVSVESLHKNSQEAFMQGKDNVKTIRVLYYGAGWPTNIGNAFIDLGAIAILRTAIPNAQIAFASEMPRWFFGMSAKLARNSWPTDFYPKIDKAIDIASFTQCDLVVFAGMAMCEEFILVNGAPIRALAERGVPVLLLATGGAEYTEKEKALYKNFLRQIKPIGFISRDDRSYEAYSDCVEESYKGIDCGFFLMDAYKPFHLSLPPYIVLAFDSMPEPYIDPENRQIIRAHHDCWNPLPHHLISDKTLISDIPYDYLALYANAEEVHSDRVHACVAALAYGRKAKFYHPTPRGSLFHAVGAERIKDQLVQLDFQLLTEKKRALISFVRYLIQKKFSSSE